MWKIPIQIFYTCNNIGYIADNLLTKWVYLHIADLMRHGHRAQDHLTQHLHRYKPLKPVLCCAAEPFLISLASGLLTSRS